MKYNLLQNSASSVENYILKNKFLLFLLIFGLQLILNTYKLGNNSLWFDESFSVNSANRPISDIIGISKSDPNPPLYPIFLHFWIKIFGISEFAVRLLSALAGSLACSFLFLLALRFFNWQTAVFSILMYFSSNVIFYYAQEARTYSFVLLFVILSNYCYLRLTQGINLKKGLMYGFLLGLFNIGLFYLHMLSCFNIIAQVILFPFFFVKIQNVEVDKSGVGKLMLKFNFNFFKYYFLAGIVSVLLFLPWYKRFSYLVKEGGQTWWLQKPVFQDLKNCIYDFFITQELYHIYLYSMLGVMLLLFFKKLRTDEIKFKIVLFAIISGPIALCLNYYVATYSPIFLTRYVLFTVLGFILLYTYIISLLNVKFGIKLLFLIAIAGYSFSKMDIPRKVKQDYKGAVNYLKSISDEHTLITTDLPDVYAYYLDKNIFNEKDAAKKNEMLFKRGVFAQVYDVDWPNRLDFSKIKDIYYTQSFEYLNDPQKIVIRRLNRKFDCVSKVNKYDGVFILHYINRDYK